jgi:cystathionine gamma-synthase
VTTVTVISKRTPGGRCTLYLRYAEALAETGGVHADLVFADEHRGVPPPAVRIDNCPVFPSDGVIVSPDDLAATLPGDAAGLLALLEDVQDRTMEEWAASGPAP